MSFTMLRPIGFVLALAAACATPALAQNVGEGGGGELSAWSIPGWSFVPGVTISALYDTNVALAAAPADTKTTQGDRLFIMEPFGQLNYVAPRTDFSAGYGGYLRRYTQFDQLNGFDQRGYVKLRHMATRRITYFLQDSYSKVPTTDEVQLNGLPFSRTGSRFNTVAAGLEARLTKFTDLSVRYDQSWVTFDRMENPLRPGTVLTGGVVNGVRSELDQRVADHLSVGAEYGLRVADLNEGRRVTFQDAGGALRYEVADGTELVVAGGISHLADNTAETTRTGPYVRGSVTHKSERTTVGASFERMFVPSFGFGGSNQSDELRTFIQMPLTRNRTYVQGSVTWRRSDPFVDNELRLDTLWVRSVIGYSLARWLRAEGFYAYTRQTSKVAFGGRIDRQRIGVQFVISQPVRIR